MFFQWCWSIFLWVGLPFLHVRKISKFLGISCSYYSILHIIEYIFNKSVICIYLHIANPRSLHVYYVLWISEHNISEIQSITKLYSKGQESTFEVRKFFTCKFQNLSPFWCSRFFSSCLCNAQKFVLADL